MVLVDQVHEYGAEHRGEHTGHCNGQAAHRTLYLTHLQGLARADRVRRCAERQTLRQRVGDAADLADRLAQQAADDTGQDDDRTGQRRRAAQRLGHIHADGRRNGFRQKAHGVGALQLEQPGHRQHAAQARQHARSNRRKDRGQVLFQQLPLFIQRDCQADCGGHQKPAHGLGAGLVIGVGHAEAAQKHDHKNAAHQKGIEQRLAGLAVDPDARRVGRQRRQHAPAAALLQKFSHFCAPFVLSLISAIIYQKYRCFNTF
mgnify:CR=1 FL=1